jgi:phage baseplate assembly protein W
MPDSRYHFYQNEIEGKYNQIYDYEPVIDSTGDLKRISGIDVAILAIRTLLLTPLGHYPFDPEYGSLLFKKLFEMSDAISQEEIEYEVRERIRMYEDRVSVTQVTTNFTPDRKTIIVDVHIEKDDVPGKISLNFGGNNRMFGIEDDIAAGLNN